MCNETPGLGEMCNETPGLGEMHDAHGRDVHDVVADCGERD